MPVCVCVALRASYRAVPCRTAPCWAGQDGRHGMTLTLALALALEVVEAGEVVSE